MDQVQAEMKRAVDAGYWPLYRYNPANKEHPFTLDSKEPSISYQEFLDGEVRYASLYRSFPDNAAELFAQADKDAKARYESYKKLAEQS
jgi:pyruvate-ferredoxin/flavodoxin oxidoreductase